MPVRLLAAVLVVAAGTGCGAADSAKGPRPTEPCPSSVTEVRVGDILPELPAGTELAAADPKSTKPVESALRQGMGEALRSLRTRVVVKRGRAVGVLVIVLNASEKMDPREMLLGARDSAEKTDADAEALTIAGEDGVIAVNAQGAVAVGAAGDCSGVALFGTEAEVRAVAEKVRRPA